MAILISDSRNVLIFLSEVTSTSRYTEYLPSILNVNKHRKDYNEWAKFFSNMTPTHYWHAVATLNELTGKNELGDATVF